VKIQYPLILCFFFFTSLFGQDTIISTPIQIQPGTANYLPSSWNESIGSGDFDITRSFDGESLMGNFVCDVMLNFTKSDFAFINYGELYGDLYKGEISRLDLFRIVPFNRTLVVIEMSGDTLKQIIEKTLGGIHPGLAISGGKVEYDPNRPAQNRLTFVQIGEYPLYPKKIYRIVTINYLVNGFAGFNLLSELDQRLVFRTGTLLRDSLIDYIKQNSPLDHLKVAIDDRWIRK
jgi:2',3'-cyclic-nucleotide 2'-phosphodiesterase (5'-nucleotidase family)